MTNPNKTIMHECQVEKCMFFLPQVDKPWRGHCKKKTIVINLCGECHCKKERKND